MGSQMANDDHGEEPHWCLSWAPLQCVTAVESDDKFLGKALEATAQVSLVRTCTSPETYDVYNVHMGKCEGVVDRITWANRW